MGVIVVPPDHPAGRRRQRRRAGLGVDFGLPGRGARGPRRTRHPRGSGSRARPARLQRLRLLTMPRTLGPPRSKRAGQSYERAQVVLYRDAVSTGCGNASSAVGPFYCPADQRVYLDLSFYADMERQLGAPATRLGLRDRARGRPPRAEPDRHEPRGTPAPERESRRGQRPVGAPGAAGRLLRRLCGPTPSTRGGDLQRGDVREAITASESVGDDRLQSPRRRLGEPRLLHARKLRAAGALVQRRARERRARRLRRLLGRRALGGGRLPERAMRRNTRALGRSRRRQRVWVVGEEPEARVVAGRPLEVVHERPGEVATGP